MDEFRGKNNRLPEPEEIAREFGINREEVEYQVGGGILSYDSIRRGVKDELILEEDTTVKAMDFALISEKLNRAMSLLETRMPRNIDILRMLFGLPPYNREYTLDEVAERHKITRQRVRQVEEICLRDLRLRAQDQDIRLRRGEVEELGIINPRK